MNETQRRSRRFVRCDGARVKKLRLELGWRQIELAKRSGWSERLIQKAEAFGSVQPTVLQNIAAALSTEEKPVSPEYLCLGTERIVDKFIACFRVGELDGHEEVPRLLHPEITCRFHSKEPNCVFCGEHTGKPAFFEFWNLLFASISFSPASQFEPIITCDVHRTTFGAFGLAHLITSNAGQEFESPLFVLIQLSNGSIIRIEILLDTAALNAAMHPNS